MNNNVKDMLEGALESIRTTISANSVIGDAITTQDGTVIIPITRVSFGFGGGGGDFSAKSENTIGTFAGGIGGGANVKAEAFLVINNGNVRLISMNGSSTPVDRIIDMVPEAISKVNDFIEKKKAKGEEKTSDDND